MYLKQLIHDILAVASNIFLKEDTAKEYQNNFLLFIYRLIKNIISTVLKLSSAIESKLSNIDYSTKLEDPFLPSSLVQDLREGGKINVPQTLENDCDTPTDLSICDSADSVGNNTNLDDSNNMQIDSTNSSSLQDLGKDTNNNQKQRQNLDPREEVPNE